MHAFRCESAEDTAALTRNLLENIFFIIPLQVTILKKNVVEHNVVTLVLWKYKDITILCQTKILA